MDAFRAKRNRSDGPEAEIQVKIEHMLRIYGWFTKPTIGNMLQSGFPDLFICHSKYGHRWVEVKNPVCYRFTAAQLEVFPKLCANGSPVWVLVAADDWEYKKLFVGYNWHEYLK